MCEHVKLPDGTAMIICGTRQRTMYCACGRVCDYLCDWKVREKKSGTCDAPICTKHALQVGPEKHLCPQHQKAWEAWQKRHPNQIPTEAAQMSLL